LLPARICDPGCDNSIRSNIDRVVPITPDTAPKIRYKVPISLWLVEKSHLDDQLYAAEAILEIYVLTLKESEWKTILEIGV